MDIRILEDGGEHEDIEHCESDVNDGDNVKDNNDVGDENSNDVDNDDDYDDENGLVQNGFIFVFREDRSMDFTLYFFLFFFFPLLAPVRFACMAWWSSSSR